jgi:hypothetical protein
LFDAVVSDDLRGITSIVFAIRRGDTTFASVNFVDWETNCTVGNGEHCRKITRARIDHIAIVNSHAVYSGTGVWIGSDEDCLPPRLAALRDDWRHGINVDHMRAAACRRP